MTACNKTKDECMSSCLEESGGNKKDKGKMKLK